jgi:hypothetical protein
MTPKATTPQMTPKATTPQNNPKAMAPTTTLRGPSLVRRTTLMYSIPL